MEQSLYVLRTFRNSVAAATDDPIVAVVFGCAICVLGLTFVFASAVGAINTAILNTKPVGAGFVISGIFTFLTSALFVVLLVDFVGWFQINQGEGLSVTIGAGGAFGVS